MVYSRLDGLAGRLEKVLDLAGVGTKLVQDVAVALLGGSRAVGGRAAAHAVARRTTMRHVCRDVAGGWCAAGKAVDVMTEDGDAAGICSACCSPLGSS